MFEPGDDVIVSYDGEDCPGEVINYTNGWVLARVLIDPVTDYGSVTDRLSPISNVMVRESEVRLADG